MLPTKFQFIWPNGFRGEEFKKSANQKQESPVAVMFVNGSERNEQYLERTFHRCFLSSFSSFGLRVSEEKIKIRVSEEKIKMWKVNGRQTTDNGRQTPSDGKSSHCLWQGELNMDMLDYLRKIFNRLRRIKLTRPIKGWSKSSSMFCP